MGAESSGFSSRFEGPLGVKPRMTPRFTWWDRVGPTSKEVE